MKPWQYCYIHLHKMNSVRCGFASARICCIEGNKSSNPKAKMTKSRHKQKSPQRTIVVNAIFVKWSVIGWYTLVLYWGPTIYLILYTSVRLAQLGKLKPAHLNVSLFFSLSTSLSLFAGVWSFFIVIVSKSLCAEAHFTYQIELSIAILRKKKLLPLDFPQSH